MEGCRGEAEICNAVVSAVDALPNAAVMLMGNLAVVKTKAILKRLEVLAENWPSRARLAGSCDGEQVALKATFWRFALCCNKTINVASASFCWNKTINARQVDTGWQLISRTTKARTSGHWRKARWQLGNYVVCIIKTNNLTGGGGCCSQWRER